MTNQSDRFGRANPDPAPRHTGGLVREPGNASSVPARISKGECGINKNEMSRDLDELDRELMERQKRHMEGLRSDIEYHPSLCKHNNCSRCHGTGVTATGPCHHSLVCRCARCYPVLSA